MQYIGVDGSRVLVSLYVPTNKISEDHWRRSLTLRRSFPAITLRLQGINKRHIWRVKGMLTSPKDVFFCAYSA